MKRIIIIAGGAVLLVGLVLFSSNAVLGQVAASIGMQTTTTVANPPNKLIVIPAGNYSYFSATVPKDGTLASTFTMSPSGLNIFVMNPSNFATFQKNDSAFTIKSFLNQSSPVSLSLTNDAAASETYYFVIQNNIPARQASDVLVHYEITSKSVWSETRYLPYIIVVIGLVLIAFGMLPNSKNEKMPTHPPMRVASPSYQSVPSEVPSVTNVCKFCGATMSPTETFCPACKKSQI